jgi:hypothetical protein
MHTNKTNTNIINLLCIPIKQTQTNRYEWHVCVLKHLSLQRMRRPSFSLTYIFGQWPGSARWFSGQEQRAGSVARSSALSWPAGSVARSSALVQWPGSARCLLSHARDQWFPTYKLRICEIWKKISRQNHFRIRTLIFPSVQNLSASVHYHQRDIFRKKLTKFDRWSPVIEPWYPRVSWAKDHDYSCVSAPSETTLVWFYYYIYVSDDFV